MRQLTLIRHALTEWNTTGRFQGHSEVHLSNEGKKQAQQLSKHLSRLEDITLVYSSPLARALETARVAFPQHEIVADERLKELNFGVFEGFTQQENEQHPAWQDWYADPFGRRTPGGESYGDLRLRAVAWLADLPAEGHIVAVTHSGTIQMLLSHILGVERPTWRKRIFLRHTGISRILFRGGDALIERVNDTRHLSRDDGDPFAD